MPNILVINSGSTSLKYSLFNDKEEEIKSGKLTEVNDIEKSIKIVLKEIGDLQDLKAVGHRVVHGGGEFFEPILIDDNILENLESFSHLAPLHNPYNLAGIRAVKDFLPDIQQVAVFDTAFFSALPELARTYALPKKIIEKYKIRRFGFHGISHEYAMKEASRELGKDVSKINLITCHLGGGWSVAAIEKGKPIDTSMGWTPLEGLVMMTRAGDIDSGIVVELMKNSESPLGVEQVREVYDLLNFDSGIKGLTGLDNYQDLLKEASLGYKDAKLAFDLAIYRLVKYIGSYWTILGGQVDAIVFTGAIGSGNPMTRNAVMKKLKFLGNVLMIKIEANEELAIARKVSRLI